MSKAPRWRDLLALCSLFLALGVAGCGSSNPNEQEFLKSAPPGKPLDNPNETVSERRSRTRNVPKQVAAAEAKLKAAAEKSAAEKKSP